MLKLIGVIGLLVAVAVTYIDCFAWSNNKLDCKGVSVTSVDQLADPKHVCNILKANPGAKMKPMENLVTAIEQCLCNLLPKPEVWESIHNDKVEYWFEKIMEALEASEYGINEMDVLKRFDKLVESRSYNISVFGFSHKRKGPFVPGAEDTCRKLIDSFQPFMDYFQVMAKLSENPHLIYRMTAYEPSFFRVFLVWKGCKTALEK